MHAFLITGGESGDEYLSYVPIDYRTKKIPFTLQKIEDVRNLKRFLKHTISEKGYIVLNDFDQATVDAQNAFLKLLEEPQDNIIYVILTTNLNNILPTIQSRCEITRIKNVKSGKLVKDQLVLNFKSSNIDKRFEILDKIKERNDAVNFVEGLIISDHTTKIFDFQEHYLKTLKNLKSNGNVSLQLTNLLVTMNSHG